MGHCVCAPCFGLRSKNQLGHMGAGVPQNQPCGVLGTSALVAPKPLLQAPFPLLLRKLYHAESCDQGTRAGGKGRPAGAP